MMLGRNTSVLRAMAFLDTRERIHLALTTVLRLLLVLLDLVGVTLVGIAISIASGTTTSSTSVTGKIIGYVTSLGFSHGYAVIALMAVIFFLSKAFLSIWLNHWMNDFSARIEKQKATQVFKSIFAGSLDEIGAWTAEELNLGLLASFQTSFGTTLSTISAVFGELALIAVISLFLAYSNFLAFAVLVAYFALLAIAMHLILNRKSGQLGTESTKNQLSASTNIYDGIRNFRQVTTSGKSSFFTDSFTDARSKVAVLNSRQMTISMMPRYIMEVALMVGIGALISQLSTRNVANLTPATVAVFVAGAFRIVGSLLPLQGYLALLKHSEANSKLSLDLCEQYLVKSGAVDDDLPLSPKTLNPPEIVFRNVSYRYPSRSRLANSNISLKINPGDFIAVRGRSGSGKSTFTDLLLGLRRPLEGKVLINGIPAWLFVKNNPGKIAYVSQSTPLFSGTLLENITLERDHSKISWPMLQQSINQSHLFDLVEVLPEGLETMLSASATQLSGGQIQRVGLARALYLDSSILILDEATSSLDIETEATIAENLERLKKTKTVVVVAHRDATIKLANRTFEFAGGTVREVF